MSPIQGVMKDICFNKKKKISHKGNEAQSFTQKSEISLKWGDNAYSLIVNFN